MPNINRTVERLKELVQTYESNMAYVRSKPVFDQEARIWVKQLKADFLKEVTELVKRL